MLLKIIAIIYVLSQLLQASYASGDLHVTSSVCVKSEVELKCKSNEIILIQNVLRTNSPACIDSCDTHSSHCSSNHAEDVKFTCEGKSACNFTLQTQQHYTGFYGSNCNFKSNRAQINYACVPIDYETSTHKYDICNSVFSITKSRTNHGFIHSPDYPRYYGNNRKCKMMISLEEGERLELYLLQLNIEGRSLFNKVNDYLKINSDKYYGYRRNLIIYNTTKDVCIDFVSDFITTQQLTMPKGFLLYFKISTYTQKTLWDKITQTVSSIIFSSPKSTTTTQTPIYTSTTTNSTKLSTTTTQNSIEIAKNDQLGIDHNLDKLKIQEEKSTLLTCIIAALAGLMIILIISILLILRRRQRQENEDYYDENKYYVIIDKILTLNGRLRREEKPKQTSMKKEQSVDLTVKQLDDDYKTIHEDLKTQKVSENIYSSNPLEDKEAQIEEISTQRKSNLTLNSEDLYEVISELYNEPCIYSTPTNRDVETSLDETADTSTTKLVNH